MKKLDIDNVEVSDTADAVGIVVDSGISTADTCVCASKSLAERPVDALGIVELLPVA